MRTEFWSEMIGVIFDCDGVLVDTEYAHFLCWQKALQRRGISWDKKDHYPLSGTPSHLIARKFAEVFHLDSSEELLEEKRRLFLELQKQGFSGFPFTIQLLRKLHEKKESLGIKLGLASGARQREIQLHLKQLKLTNIFDVVVSGYDDLDGYQDPEGTNKPKPYIYLHAAKLLGINPLACAAVEDSEPGLLAASRAGMITFAIPHEFSENHDFSLATYLLLANQEIDLLSFYEKIQKEIASRNLH